MNTVNAAKESFLALPAGVRNSFGNDLAKFVAYVDHCIETGDLDPLREMGLAVPKRDKSPEEPKGDSTPKPPRGP